MQDHDSTSSNLPTAHPTDRRALLAGIGGLAAGALLAGKAHAGPLTPPPGPITPTPGPEPRTAINQINTPGDANSTFRITQPGSYYFPGNLSGAPQKSGILIASSDVTIDMMGFRLQPINVGSGSGIINSGARVNITIRNGVVTKWEGSGIDLASGVGVQCSNIRIEGVTVTENLARGIRAGQNAIVQHCIAQANGGWGIQTSSRSVIQNCTAHNNTSYGIFAGRSSVVSHCIASENGTGIKAGDGCTLIACTATSNTDHGIDCDSGCTITQCVAASNQGTGIYLTPLSGFGDCTAVACVSYFNADHGFDAGSRCKISGCNAFSNGGSGIEARGSSLISDNACSRNKSAGISVSSNNSIVRGNVCSANINASGIVASSSNNRIEDNNCADNERGISCTVAGNILLRNTCSENTVNWNIAAGNSYLIVQAAITTSNFTGNAGGSGVGSTNPHANFTF